MAPSYISAVVLFLSQVLPILGVSVGSDALTTTLQTVIAIVVGVIVALRQISSGRSTWFGTRPQ